MSVFRKATNLLKQSPNWLPLAVAAIGLVVYLAQAIHFAHTTISSLDEGAYLYKGWLFATGQYRPFEPYGVLTNKAPLAFLIPGYAQLIFGPGLLTGRYFAVLLGALTVAATWWTARRLSGGWLAAAAVWTMALQPAVIKIYSEGVSQATTVFFLSLVLLLSLGAGRPQWQLILAGLLAGIVILVRQNMALVLPLLILYILWEHGWRPALYTGLAGAAVLLFSHILYWPYIMRLWTPWLPDWLDSLFPLERIQDSGTSVWDPQLDFSQRLLSFFQGVRFYFVAMAGLTTGLVLWPKRRNWESDSHFRAAIFLAVLFAGLMLMHSWASLTRDYCVFCFTPYLAFFNVSAILFAVILIRVWEKNATLWRQLLLVALLLVLIAGVGYSAFEDLGDSLLNLGIVPRIREGSLQPGFATIWEVLFNKFALERNEAKRIASTAAGVFLGLILLTVAFLFYSQMKKARVNYAYVLALLVMSFGLVAGPLFAGSGGQADCQMDVIATSQQVGAHLARYIPAGSEVYWNGGLSVAPLLYAPEIKIYPPQINGSYSRRNGGDGQELLRFGLWNDELARLWWQEADFIIVEGWRYSQASFPANEFDELPRSPVPTSCVARSEERIFRRK